MKKIYLKAFHVEKEEKYFLQNIFQNSHCLNIANFYAGSSFVLWDSLLIYFRSFSSLKKCDVIAFEVELEGPTGCEEPGAWGVVAVSVNGRQVFLIVNHVNHVVKKMVVLKIKIKPIWKRSNTDVILLCDVSNCINRNF